MQLILYTGLYMSVLIPQGHCTGGVMMLLVTRAEADAADTEAQKGGRIR